MKSKENSSNFSISSAGASTLKNGIKQNVAYFFSLVYVDGSLERVADSEDENNASQERGHRTVPPVGVALGDGVVVRMRLGNKKQVTRSCGRGPG
jgi:hypothetical protein